MLLARSQADLDSGRYSQAIEHSQHCATLFRANADAKNLAASLRVTGLAQLYSGLYAQAIITLTEALARARQLGDFGSEIARLNEIGTVYYFQGRYRESLDRYEEAEARARAVPNDPWTPWARQVTTANIAILYQTLGQFDRALELYTGLLHSNAALTAGEQAQLLSNAGALLRRLGDPVKALETYRTAQGLYARASDFSGEIAVLDNIGIVQTKDLGDFKAADSTFSRALQIAGPSGNRPLALQVRMYRGEARYRGGQLDLSQADLRAAAEQAHQLGSKEEEWKALYGLARIEAARGNTQAARRLALQAVELIEALRTNAGTSQQRSTFLVDKRAAYDLLIETATNDADAFHWMEQSRARTLADQSPRQAATLDQLRRQLPRDTAVLEFWIGSKTAAAVLWITATGVGMKRFTPPDLAGVAAMLSDPNRRDWRNLLQPVADALLSGIPALSDPNIHRLRIIPDGPLATLPFEALPLGPTDLLIQKFAVSYAPSASLTTTIKPASAARFRWPWQPSFAGFADPQPGNVDANGGLIGARSWAPLPYSRAETMQAARLIGGRTAVHVGADARKETLTAATGFPILHLATHAQADLQDPERSFILLAPAAAQRQQYDYLFSKEVDASSFAKTELVTLSACETNVGVYVPGEGLRGFGEAFLGAGARSVLNSLWSVGDKSTDELMTRFYGNLASGEAVADALRKAKLDFIAYPQSSHPAHWAAFVLNGDGDWSMPRLIGWPWIGLALAAIGLAVYWFLKRR